MPFTPYHLGPGLLIKAASPRTVSFTAFAAANVVIDFESGYYLLRGAWPVHRILHTFALACPTGLLVGWLCFVLAHFISTREPSLSHWRATARAPALTGGFLGAFSHVVLDGIMHGDIHPFRPLTPSNPLLGLVSLQWLHAACVGGGLLGLLWLVLHGRGFNRA